MFIKKSVINIKTRNSLFPMLLMHQQMVK